MPHGAHEQGERTRQTILDAAVDLASERGFEALSIGLLAERVGMSKSGLFAHFGSREELQIAAIANAAERFAELVFKPAMAAPRGLARLEAFSRTGCRGWTAAACKGGCPLQAAAHEFGCRPDRCAMRWWRTSGNSSRTWGGAVRLAVDSGELRADTDVGLLVFRLLGIVLAFYHRRDLMSHDDASADTRAAFAALLAASRRGSPDAAVAIDGASKA